MIALDCYFLHLPFIRIGNEIAENDVFLHVLRLTEHVIKKDENQSDDQPQGNIFL